MRGTVEVHCSPGRVIGACCLSGSRTVREHDKTEFVWLLKRQTRS